MGPTPAGFPDLDALIDIPVWCFQCGLQFRIVSVSDLSDDVMKVVPFALFVAGEMGVHWAMLECGHTRMIDNAVLYRYYTEYEESIAHGEPIRRELDLSGEGRANPQGPAPGRWKTYPRRTAH